MEYKEYMDTLGEQIQDPRARRMVLGEIRGHIEEQCAAYEAEGMEREKALAESVRQMGDAAQIGAQMNRIHRPRIPLGLIGLALALTAIGILTQFFVFYRIADPPSWTNVWLCYGPRTLFYNLLGLALMLGLMYLDYGFIGRHAYLWYGLYMALLVCASFWASNHAHHMRYPLYYIFSLYPILLAALLYRNRQQGCGGLARCMALTLVFLAWALCSGQYAACGEAVLVCGPLLAVAVIRNIFGGNRRLQAALLSGTALVSATLGIISLALAGSGRTFNYALVRLAALLRPESAVGTAGYTILRQRELLGTGQYSLWGGTELPAWMVDRGIEWNLADTYVLSAVFSLFGVIAGAAVAGSLLFFAGRALRLSLCQSNRLGMLLGSACALGLLVRSVTFIAINLGFGLYYTTGIPFLAYGLGNAVSNGLLVGLLLCVCRNSAILGEDAVKSSKGFGLGKHRYRLRLERLPEEN